MSSSYATKIMQSYLGHMYKSASIDGIISNLKKAEDENKYINVASGRLVLPDKYDKYTYSEGKYRLAIPLPDIDEEDAEELFELYEEAIDRELSEYEINPEEGEAEYVFEEEY